MEELLLDLEADGLLPEATRLHTIQLGALTDHGEATVYCDALPGYRSIAEGLTRVSGAGRIVGHNLIGYDVPLLNRLYPGVLDRPEITDTLVLGRLAFPEERHQKLGEWGERLGISKGDYEGPWDACTPEMVAYAAQDIRVTRALYEHLRFVEEWGDGRAAALEHRVAMIIAQQEANGFVLDVKAAEDLAADVRQQLADLEAELQTTFPPIERCETFIPKRDNRTLGYTAGVPFIKKRMETFNPASRTQIAERLKALGWRPKLYTPSGAPQVDEKSLDGLPWPEAKLLTKYFLLLKLLGQVADGENGWLKLVGPDGRVHGRVNPNGTRTGRMSHFKPNMGQVSKKDDRARAVWIARPGWKLVGCDAEGLEARMLGHFLYTYDGGAFADRVVHGDKSKGTDVHTMNLKAGASVGLVTRDKAKTALYALMYGAGDAKLGSVVKDDCREHGKPVPKTPNKKLGGELRAALVTAMVGIDKLTEDVKRTANRRGYIRGLDDRHLLVPSDPVALNTLLQSAGAVVMKEALSIFWDRFGYSHGTLWGLCANVHDEVQLECEPAIADKLGKGFAECITEAGERFNLHCPLAGDYAIGNNWHETH